MIDPKLMYDTFQEFMLTRAFKNNNPTYVSKTVEAKYMMLLWPVNIWTSVIEMFVNVSMITY